MSESSTSLRNRAIVVNSRPKADGIGAACLSVASTDVAPLEPLQSRVRNIWLSIDPGMLNRVRDEPSYVPPLGIGDIVSGFAIGKVIESLDPARPVGTHLTGAFGWQEMFTLSPTFPATAIDDNGPLQRHLGLYGVSGLTAYFGLFDIGQPRPGETVVVSAAAGAVGMIVGQLAKLCGARVVGLTRSAEKGEFLTESLGFDAWLDYRSKGFPAGLQETCPDGVDVYFDNTGGSTADAILPVVNIFGRIVVCGRVALAPLAAADHDVGRRDHNWICVKRIRKQGLLVFDYASRFPEGHRALRRWVQRGHLQLPEVIRHGIDEVLPAVDDVMNGRNLGKQLVSLVAS